MKFLKRPPSLYWAAVLLLAAFLLALGLQMADVEEAQEQARQAIKAARQSQAVADRRQGLIEALQERCSQLQDICSAEQERFERGLAELGERNQ